MMYPIKKCEFCGKTGPAYTWDVTICPECHKTVSSNIGDCWKEIFQLRAKLRDMIEAAEWRDECEETVVHSLTESVRYGTLECEIDTKKKRHNDLWRSIYLKVGKWRLAAEAAYQASIKAAKEVEG